MAEKRIYRPKKIEPLVDQLIEENLFETKQAVMMFAAATGWHINKRKPIGLKGEPIRWDIFERHNDDVFILALALAESGDMEILGGDRTEDADDPIKIFEEYATAGLEYIEERCIKAHGDTLDNLLSLLAEVHTRDDEPPQDL